MTQEPINELFLRSYLWYTGRSWYIVFTSLSGGYWEMTRIIRVTKCAECEECKTTTDNNEDEMWFCQQAMRSVIP